ncbi:MAG: HlyD family efflux transporter periplasmic adaptor subunit [Anaerolineae bacterium]|nr:HlyD family efflux transporter periplasmic adaptor subunit [Anaerolineae bacterium]
MAGTIVALNADAGEAVGTAPIATLADLAAPLVRFWVEETDLISVAPGNPVEIVFEALPDLVFARQVAGVDPALVTVDGTPAVQAWAGVDLSSHAVSLISGLTAGVEIIAGEAKGALLVPVQALRETTPGRYAVFVVKPDGKLELRPVEVGLKDFASAEVLSGLEKSEVVSTGTIEIETE